MILGGYVVHAADAYVVPGIFNGVAYLGWIGGSGLSHGFRHDLHGIPRITGVRAYFAVFACFFILLLELQEEGLLGIGIGNLFRHNELGGRQKCPVRGFSRQLEINRIRLAVALKKLRLQIDLFGVLGHQGATRSHGPTNDSIGFQLGQLG